MNKSTKHEFALYSKQLPKNTQQIALTDSTLLQRTSKVLRLQRGETFTLFDGIQVFEVIIVALDKKQCVVEVKNASDIVPLKPEITCIVPVLKREALEEVIYAAVELGANEIQLLFTEKVSRAWAGVKELDRLHAIMIAACEQSKQFAIPVLHAPINFTEMIKKLSGILIFFDADGKPAYDVMTELREDKPFQFSIMIGPEADLAHHEKDMLKEKGVVFCKLTPTVLRARQAFAVGLGMLRSML